MGMKINNADGSVQRDLGIAPIKSQQLTNEINASLVASSIPNLQLKIHPNFSNTSNQYYYEQLNIRASRKQILPIVQTILDRK